MSCFETWGGWLLAGWLLAGLAIWYGVRARNHAQECFEAMLRARTDEALLRRRLDTALQKNTALRRKVQEQRKHIDGIERARRLDFEHRAELIVRERYHARIAFCLRKQVTEDQWQQARLQAAAPDGSVWDWGMGMEKLLGKIGKE